MSFPTHKDHVKAMLTRLHQNRLWVAGQIGASNPAIKPSQSKPPFEFTHTLASMLLMLSLTEIPRRPAKDRVRHPLQQAQSDGWPKISRKYTRDGSTGQLECWFDQLDLIRHALAHGRVTLHGKHTGKIESVTLQTTKGKIWKATVAASDIERMAEYMGTHLPTKDEK